MRDLYRSLLALSVVLATFTFACGDSTSDGSTSGAGGEPLGGGGGAGGEGGGVMLLCPPQPPGDEPCDTVDVACYYYGFDDCPTVHRCLTIDGVTAWRSDVPEGDCDPLGAMCEYDIDRPDCLGSGVYTCDDTGKWQGEVGCE